MAAPDAGFTALHTFQMLPGPARRDGQAATGVDDPMISNSIANRAIREQIVKAFEGRGYTRVERNADFAVAFYATAREKLDVNAWDYGYPFYPGSPRYPRPVERVTTYTEGSVIIDVIKPVTRDLLWRGEGKARAVRRSERERGAARQGGERDHRQVPARNESCRRDPAVMRQEAAARFRGL